MLITINELRSLIKEVISEISSPKGALRRVRGSGGQQYKIGKIEEENRELSSFEAEQAFPGSTSAWVEIVPQIFPEFPFDDPFAIKKHTLWFKIGSELRTSFDMHPGVELASWDPAIDDWKELEP